MSSNKVYHHRTITRRLRVIREDIYKVILTSLSNKEPIDLVTLYRGTITLSTLSDVKRNLPTLIPIFELPEEWLTKRLEEQLELEAIKPKQMKGSVEEKETEEES